ncbi:MBL fold metallo-hydrolase [Cohnella hongkongensis]|uniref:MBL fold metallo-hydrolase n=1 Tax=Cohnella hongkongensis TaxID=178337 RepID=A0ABV9FAB5_9BACL
MTPAQTEFVLYSGLRTIGGVIASVTYGKDRVFFEMGSAYDPKTDVFDGKVIGRRRSWLKDKLRLGIVPKLDGIFRREDLLGAEGVVSAEDSPYNTAVLITHLHLDHMAFMGMVSPDIPVYLHENAQKIERALERVGLGIETVERTYTPFQPNVPIRIGAIEVLPILTNPKSYCDFAFLITTPDGTIHWTGDLSLHGKHADLTLKQMEILKEREIDVLLCDCTSFMDSVVDMIYGSYSPNAIVPEPDVPPGMLSEEDVESRLFAMLEAQTGLCVINFYEREMAEASRYIEWASRTGRLCAFEPETAYLVYAFYGQPVHVYIPDSPRYPIDRSLQPGWLQEVLAACPVVTLEEVRRRPGGYLLQNSYPHILELLDLPGEGGAYLHADGMPIGDFDPAYANLKRVIERTEFRYVTFFSQNYFGHGYPSQVKYFVDQVNPKVLIPCHSFQPERLLPKDGKQLLPKLGQTYVLRDGDLVEADDN